MHKAILLVAGGILALIGAATLLFPTAFHGLTGTDVEGSAALLSELRAPGGALVAIGVLVVAGAFQPPLAAASSLVGALTYLSYAASRVLSSALDGLPPTKLLIATAAELALGLACLHQLRRPLVPVRPTGCDRGSPARSR
ncbi:DUF4345 domain-containing protein [Actinosynnema sp. NPDC050436]|uniref:DUF4345 domain-containing protein n=1 Tax=Actinosynnema sp. NPDC050436 TaxID=3155659 RepID=UPI0033D31129